MKDSVTSIGDRAIQNSKAEAKSAPDEKANSEPHRYLTKEKFISLPEMKKTRSWILWAGIAAIIAGFGNVYRALLKFIVITHYISACDIILESAFSLCAIGIGITLIKTKSTGTIAAVAGAEIVISIIAMVSGIAVSLWELGLVSGSLAIIGAARINKRWKQYCSRSEACSAAAAEQAPEQKQTALLQEIHSEERNDGWIQYDILYPFGYGWDNMISAADNIIAADFSKIEKITYGYSPYESIDITADFENNGCKCKGLTALEDEEGSNIAVFGESRSLKLPVKIIWFNQTRFVRIITIPLWKEIVIRKYGETVIGKSFGL